MIEKISDNLFINFDYIKEVILTKYNTVRIIYSDNSSKELYDDQAKKIKDLLTMKYSDLHLSSEEEQYLI